MAIQRQRVWGKLVVLDMFFGGIGAGIFPVGFILILLDQLNEVARIGMLLGPILIIVGLIFLLIELGAPINAYRVLTGLPSSWLSRGSLIQVLFIIFSLGYVVPAFWISSWLTSTAGLIVGTVATILALVTTVYHGLLISQAKGLPLWSSPIIPFTFFLTATSSGLGLMFLVIILSGSVYPVYEVTSIILNMGNIGISLIVVELIILFSMLGISTSITYRKSIESLTVLMKITIGLLIVLLILLVSSVWIKDIGYLQGIPTVIAILFLVTGFFIRSSIISAGYYYPLQFH